MYTNMSGINGFLTILCCLLYETLASTSTGIIRVAYGKGPQGRTQHRHHTNLSCDKSYYTVRTRYMLDGLCSLPFGGIQTSLYSTVSRSGTHPSPHAGTKVSFFRAKLTTHRHLISRSKVMELYNHPLTSSWRGA
jgi:hypothetical protein